MTNIAIKIENISKEYRIYKTPIERLKDVLGLGFNHTYDEFTALKDISVDIFRGETVGIVGTNGSGKSTLLKIITNVVEQSQGKVSVNGKISAILELGTGFNPELTGLENIYQNGLILGFSKQEVQEKVSSIVDFSELGDFIHRPIKTYSSGMYARLAFSVAIDINPDILIVDEALSVGDARFQKKCFTRIKQMRDNGVTILFVSHSLDSIIQLCDRAILLDKGSLIMVGKTKEVTKEYNKRLFGSVNEQNILKATSKHIFTELQEELILPSLILEASKSLDGGKIFPSIKTTLLNKDQKPFSVCTSGEKIYIKVDIMSKYNISNLSLAIELIDKKGMLLTGESTFNKFDETFSIPKNSKKELLFSFMSEFIEDDYFIQVRINRITQKDRSDNVLLYINEHAASFTLTKNMIQRQWFKVKKQFNIEISGE